MPEPAALGWVRRERTGSYSVSYQCGWACGVLGAGPKVRSAWAPAVVSTRHGASWDAVITLSPLPGFKQLCVLILPRKVEMR